MTTRLDNFDYDHWLAVATSQSRRRNESADLLHDALVDAIRAGRTNFDDASTQGWFAGVLRNRAAMAARSAARRTRREQLPRTRGASDIAERDVTSPPPDFLDSLPRAARGVAVLALAGMRREEIVAALGIADTAFRQRLTTIRKAWDAFRRDHPDAVDRAARDDDALHPRPDPEFELGLIRRALLAAVQHHASAVGAHDPDGHLLVIGWPSSTSTSHRDRSRQQDRRKEI